MTQIWHQSNLNRLDKVNKVHEKTLMEALEIEITDIGDDYVQGTMPVNEKTKQPFGLLHGGASCVLAESVASFATALTLDISKQIPVGLSLNANHLKSATEGFVYAKATAKHLGRTTSLWDVIVTNEDKEIVSSVVFTAFHKDIK